MVPVVCSKRALSEDEETETGEIKRQCTDEQNILRAKVQGTEYILCDV